MAWDAHQFSEQLEELIHRHEDAGTDPEQELNLLYRTTAKRVLDAEVGDLAMQISQRRAEAAGFQVRLRARWGHAFDLFAMLLDRCWEIGAGTNEHYRPVAIAAEDHRFEALSRLHGRATLTASEIGALLGTGHADGAMARWRTLHEIDFLSAFLRQNSDTIAYRYLRHADAQALKIRRGYDLYADRLGYQPGDSLADDSDDRLKQDLVDEFGADFLEPNGWAIPAFGHRPKDVEIEQEADLDHYRPLYHAASDRIHATAEGIRQSLQQIGPSATIVAGPSNAGLATPGHGAAISLTRSTITLTHYCAFGLRERPQPSEQASTTLTTHLLLDLTERLGHSLLEAHERLLADEAAGEPTVADEEDGS